VRHSGSTTVCLDRSITCRNATKVPCCVISGSARTAIPLLYPGLQDITAWVDYTLLAEASRAAGFTLSGFTTQSFFLAGLGVHHEMQAMAAGDEARFARLANQARQLMLPGEMGERFKAMAWLRGMDLPLAGFALQDLRHTL